MHGHHLPKGQLQRGRRGGGRGLDCGKAYARLTDGHITWLGQAEHGANVPPPLPLHCQPLPAQRSVCPLPFPFPFVAKMNLLTLNWHLEQGLTTSTDNLPFPAPLCPLPPPLPPSLPSHMPSPLPSSSSCRLRFSCAASIITHGTCQE